MEYYQMTINDWLYMKQKLQAELLGVRRSFVRIGYILRKIDESKGYENDGYKTITEWAKSEYGLEGSTVSRFMAINREYSIGGFSEELLPEFEDFKRSQLEEMLKLPAADREMITPETPRADIRDLKQFNKQEPAAGVADDIHQLVQKFFDENETVLKEVYAVIGNVEAMKEVVNPSGNRSYRKGAFFLMMYEDGIKLKKFGGSPESYSWQQFFGFMTDIYGMELEKEEEHEYIAVEDKQVVKQEVKQEREADESRTGGDHHVEESAREVVEDKVRTEDENKQETTNCAGAKTLERLEEEPILEEKKSTVADTQEVIEKPFGTRKEYMDSLTAWGMALYLKREMDAIKGCAYDPKVLEEYLKAPVNDQGHPWEV